MEELTAGDKYEGWGHDQKLHVIDCHNHGNVSCGSAGNFNDFIFSGVSAGGIFGALGIFDFNDDVLISGCSNSGTIFAGYMAAGGIIGSGTCKWPENSAFPTKVLANCSNSGEIIVGKWGAGDLIGGQTP